MPRYYNPNRYMNNDPLVEGVQYQSQINPEFQQGLMGLLQQKQQKYDQTNAAQAEAFARMQEIMAANASNNERQSEVMDNLKQGYQGIVQKHNGDLAAASNDIVNFIGQMKQDPYWKLNEYQKQQIEKFSNIKDKLGEKALIFKDPRAVPIYNKETGKYANPEDLNFDVEERIEDDPIMQSLFADMPQRGGTNQYIEKTIDIGGKKRKIAIERSVKGISKEDIDNYLPEAMERYRGTTAYKQRVKQFGQDAAEQYALDKLSATGHARVGQIVDDRAIGGLTDDGSDGSGNGVFTGNPNFLINTQGAGVKSNNPITSVGNYRDAVNNSDAYKNDAQKSLQFNVAKNITEKLLSENSIRNNGLDQYIVRNSNGDFDSLGTLKNIKTQGKKLEQDYRSSAYEGMEGTNSGNYMSMHTPFKTTKTGKDLVQIKKFLDNYDNEVDKYLESDKGDLGVEFYDFNLGMGDVKVDAEMNKRIGYLKNQMDRVDPDNLTFLAGDKDMDFQNMSNKKMENHKEYQEMKKKGYTLTGIGATEETGTIFKIKSPNGHEFVVKPKNDELTYALTGHFGDQRFADAENNLKAKKFINDRVQNSKENTTFGDLLQDVYSNPIQYKVLMTYMHSKDLTPDSKLSYQ